MQPGSDPCFPHPSPACRVTLSSQINTILNPGPICCSFSWLRLFLQSLTTNPCSCSQEQWYFQRPVSVKYSPGMLLLFIAFARLEKSRMGKFPYCPSILLGHSAYESIKWAWDCSLAPRPTGTGYVTFTLLNSHAFWIRVATGIIPCRDYPWLILVPKPHLGIRKAVRVYQVKIMSRSFPISRDLPWPPAGRPLLQGWISVQAKER